MLALHVDQELCIQLFGKPAVRYYRTVQRGEPRINRVQW